MPICRCIAAVKPCICLYVATVLSDISAQLPVHGALRRGRSLGCRGSTQACKAASPVGVRWRLRFSTLGVPSNIAPERAMPVNLPCSAMW